MNRTVDAIRLVCLEFIADNRLSQEAFDNLWIDAAPILRETHAFEIEPPGLSDTESFLSSGLEIIIESLALAIIGNFLSDTLKALGASAWERLRSPAGRRQQIQMVGNLDEEQRRQAANILDWIADNQDRILKILERTKRSNQENNEKDLGNKEKTSQ